MVPERRQDASRRVIACRGRLVSHAGCWTKPPGAEVDAERIQGSAVWSARTAPVDETPGLDSATGGFVDGEGSKRHNVH
jgi:hypothetical protein